MQLDGVVRASYFSHVFILNMYATLAHVSEPHSGEIPT